MHRGPWLIKQVYHKGKCVHVTLEHPKMKACENNGYKSKVWECMQVHDFFTIIINTSSTITTWKGKGTHGHWHKIDIFSHIYFDGNCFVTLIDVKYHILEKNFMHLFILLVRICELKICGDYIIKWPTFFPFTLSWMICINHCYIFCMLQLSFNK